MMSGGAGADRFLFTALSESAAKNGDTIRDFNASMDLIAFEGVAHNGFAWRGASGFQKNGVTQARFEERSGALTVDIDGNGGADFAVTLTGVKLADLSASDFVWG
jgi:Ca2+-binding RTX toxin-like protein